MINLNHSIIYEVDTIPWLNYLRDKGYQIKDLTDIPSEVFSELKSYGIKYIWLLGIYEESIFGRSKAHELEVLHPKYDECLPNWTKNNIKSSPYAIKSYNISKILGGKEKFLKFRKNLKTDFDIEIILDFVPNHFAIDCKYLEKYPEYFVSIGNFEKHQHKDDHFLKKINNKNYYFAHGKDPYFPAWKDTVQLDYRNPDVHKFMIDELLNLAKMCDGVRCDMSMLILNDIFKSTWHNHLLPQKLIAMGNEFWHTAISKVKSIYPNFIFLAEVYWGKEKELLDLGFDFVYDKYLYDCVTNRTCPEVKTYINNIYKTERGRIVFLENHDEPRIASLIPNNLHFTAATCLFTLPTMKLLHFGQMEGFKTFHPIQLNRIKNENLDKDINAFYKKLFYAIQSSAISNGYFKYLEPQPAWESSPAFKNFVIYLYENDELQKDLVVINTADYRSQCKVKIDSYDMLNNEFWLADRLSDKKYLRSGNDMYHNGLYLELDPLETHILSLNKNS